MLISCPLDTSPRVGQLGHMVDLFLVFWGTSVLFSIMVVPICIPSSSGGTHQQSQLLRRLSLEDGLSPGVLDYPVLCWSDVCSKFIINTMTSQEWGTTSGAKEGWMGPEIKHIKLSCWSLVSFLKVQFSPTKHRLLLEQTFVSRLLSQVLLYLTMLLWTLWSEWP